MFELLSYPLQHEAPGWPGLFKVAYEPLSLISAGEVANVYKITLCNHFGSHMDGPKHFNERGPRLAELPLERFIYDHPLLVDIPKSFNEMVMVHDLEPYYEQIKAADLLMIRSGFSQYRASDPEQYAHNGPSISAEACKYMMDHFAHLKAVALDWLSLASISDMENGVLAHQYLLGCHHDHYICIIEDCCFDKIRERTMKRVFSIPLFIEVVDSSPITLLAEF